ncbi:RsfA family transcriptional regulator [Alkalihalobacterium chitinilyticum]|uniref:RsfA family transcriptional regulator n=1 Tax=Alkalihalobacterium chitinilyticum TaxID=2980103 RepID=A0ABT5VC99_9BACI|nr:RsfA family transcriptional regulator [Alkalihalobacterium chitinilyticum]MDE5413074.1 RsfA family transcriptional regulator [Alkalihalobacterium chitinilyticum]
MSIIRQDAWTNDEDLILAEVVLRHIREGSTQLAAFEEVGERLQRTSAACGFRWNSAIRKKYDAAITLAKKQRKKGKLTQSDDQDQANYEVEASEEIAAIPVVNSVVEEEPEAPASKEQRAPVSDMTLEDVIDYLQTYASKLGQSNQLEDENEKLKRENGKLKESNEKLKKEIKVIKKEKETINEDYRTLINIMDRARKMAVLPEEKTN